MKPFLCLEKELFRDGAFNGLMIVGEDWWSSGCEFESQNSKL